MLIILADLHHPLNLLTGFVPCSLALGTYSPDFVSSKKQCLHISAIFYNLQGLIMVKREGLNIVNKQ